MLPLVKRIAAAWDRVRGSGAPASRPIPASIARCPPRRRSSRVSKPDPGHPRRDQDHPPHRLSPPAQEAPGQDGPGNADEQLRSGLAQAFPQAPTSHARIDQDRHNPGLEQGEGQREEVEAGLDHDRGPCPRGHAAGQKAPRQCSRCPGRAGRTSSGCTASCLRAPRPREPPRPAYAGCSCAIAWSCEAMLADASSVGGKLERSKTWVDSWALSRPGSRQVACRKNMTCPAASASHTIRQRRKGRQCHARRMGEPMRYRRPGLRQMAPVILFFFLEKKPCRVVARPLLLRREIRRVRESRHVEYANWASAA